MTPGQYDVQPVTASRKVKCLACSRINWQSGFAKTPEYAPSTKHDASDSSNVRVRKTNTCLSSCACGLSHKHPQLKSRFWLAQAQTKISGMATTKPATNPRSSRHLLISILLSLICGIFIAGRLHFHQWALELDRYRTGTESGALISLVYETVYLLLRILVGGYGSFAVSRDLFVPMFRRQTEPQKAGTQTKGPARH